MFRPVKENDEVARKFVNDLEDILLTYFIESEIPGETSGEKFLKFSRSLKGFLPGGSRSPRLGSQKVSSNERDFVIFFQTLKRMGLDEAANEFVDYLINRGPNKSTMRELFLPQLPLQSIDPARGHFRTLIPVIEFLDVDSNHENESTVKTVSATSDLLHAFPQLLDSANLTEILERILNYGLTEEPQVELFTSILADHFKEFMDVNFLLTDTSTRTRLQALKHLIPTVVGDISEEMKNDIRKVTGSETRGAFNLVSDSAIFVYRKMQLANQIPSQFSRQIKRRICYLFPSKNNPTYDLYLVRLVLGEVGGSKVQLQEAKERWEHMRSNFGLYQIN